MPCAFCRVNNVSSIGGFSVISFLKYVYSLAWVSNRVVPWSKPVSCLSRCTCTPFYSPFLGLVFLVPFLPEISPSPSLVRQPKPYQVGLPFYTMKTLILNHHRVFAFYSVQQTEHRHTCSVHTACYGIHSYTIDYTQYTVHTSQYTVYTTHYTVHRYTKHYTLHSTHTTEPTNTLLSKQTYVHKCSSTPNQKCLKQTQHQL